MFYRWLFTSLFLVMWGGWAAFWIAMSRGVKAPAEAESVVSRLSHVGPLLLAAYLVAVPAPCPRSTAVLFRWPSDRPRWARRWALPASPFASGRE
jgi:hypothetical protein